MSYFSKSDAAELKRAISQANAAQATALKVVEKNELVTGLSGFSFVQVSAIAQWNITHNLGRYPAVTVIEAGGGQVFGGIVYNSLNHLTINFSPAMAGAAYLN